MLNQITTFLTEAREELKRVNWPSREETMRYTLFVTLFSLAVAFLLGMFDFLFLYLLEAFILR